MTRINWHVVTRWSAVALLSWMSAAATQAQEPSRPVITSLQASEVTELGTLPSGLSEEERVPRNPTRDYRLPATLSTTLSASGDETWRLARWSEDEKRQRHYRMNQFIGGREVVGGQLIIHADAEGEIYGLDAQFLPDRGLPTQSRVAASSVVVSVQNYYGRTLEVVNAPELIYFLAPEAPGRLAWRLRIAYEAEGEPQLDDVFVDSQSGTVIEARPQIHSALNRRIYSAGGGTSLPGTLLISEGGSSADSGATLAYNNAGSTYNYYSSTHGRDSWDAAGAQMKSTVHYGVNYNNAHWNGSLDLTYFGDGDGFSYGPWQTLDILGHEYTHGVIEAEANLTYQTESGAMNESLADIFGAMVERYANGLSADTWKVGEDTALGFYPLRSMSDPYSVPSFPESSDYYPDRHQLAIGTPPSSGNDWGWVHYNSGISNLAFYLLSQGGTHPQGKTSNTVTGIGHAKAELIFYRTLRDSLLSSDGFKPAANKSQAFAKGHYGQLSQELKSTCAAWEAVGVPDNRLDCPDPAATLLPPGGLSRTPNPDICYGVQDVWWNPVTGATYYQMRLSANLSDFTGSGVYWSGSGTTTVVNQGYGTGQSYARVHACDGNGCSELSSSVVIVKATTTCP